MVSTTEPALLKTLDVSTLHVTKQEDGWLFQAGKLMGPLWSGDLDLDLYVRTGGSWWEIGVPGSPAAAPHLVMIGAPNIGKLIAIAQGAGCAFIRLDADGPIYEDLPTFDW